MDEETKQMYDQAIAEANARKQAEKDAEEARIKKETHAEAIAYLKSQGVL